MVLITVQLRRVDTMLSYVAVILKMQHANTRTLLDADTFFDLTSYLCIYNSIIAPT